MTPLDHPPRRRPATRDRAGRLGRAVGAFLAVAPVTVARAQAPVVDVGIGAGATSCFLPGAMGGAASADVRASWPLLRVGLSGLPITSPGQVASERSATVSALTPAWHGLRLDGTLRWESPSAACGMPAPSRISMTQLSWGAHGSGFWLGFESPLQRESFAAPLPADTGESRGVERLGSVASIGAWRQVGALRVSLGVRAARGSRSWSLITPHLTSYPDSVYSDTAGWIPIIRQLRSADSVTRDVRATVMDALTRVSFASGRLAADIAIGMPVRGAGFRLKGWSDIRLAYAVAPWISLLGSATSQPVAGLSTGDGAPWRMSLGVRLASLPFSRPARGAPPPERAVASAFRAERAADGMTTIALRAPQAELVELTGDFVDWAPVRMHRDSADWWVVSIPISPGTYRVNVRIDGAAWVAPPGLPRQDDEFGGAVGVLVVR